MHSKETIVITGVSRGIGRAMALKLIELGHCVHGCATSQARLEDLQTAAQGKGHFSTVDVTDGAQVTQWAKQIVEHSGPPDRIINNAGIINKTAPFWEIPSEEFSRIIEVNINGVAQVLRAFLPTMVARKKGTLINISSGCGKRGFPEVSAYCTSKFGIEGLSLSIAGDLPQGMACIPLSPGVICTDMLMDYWGDEAQRCDTPESWAEYAVPYILSLGAEHNGQSLRVPQ